MKLLFMKPTQTNWALQPFMLKWLQCLIFSNMPRSLYRREQCAHVLSSIYLSASCPQNNGITFVLVVLGELGFVFIGQLVKLNAGNSL